jgi:hypothetical protein
MGRGQALAYVHGSVFGQVPRIVLASSSRAPSGSANWSTLRSRQDEDLDTAANNLWSRTIGSTVFGQGWTA